MAPLSKRREFDDLHRLGIQLKYNYPILSRQPYLCITINTDFMRTSALTLTAIAALLAFHTSCKKEDSNTGSGSAAGLDAGKATMSFATTNGTIGSFNASNQTYNSAILSAGTTTDQITITAAEAGMSVKTAQLAITLPKSSSTTSGNITGDFSQPSGSTVKPVMTISGGSISGSEAFTSKTGTITITKLTATEVEGTFSGNFINNSTSTNTDVSNGSFAGKFK
jgi:hypothetical protein